MDSYTDSIQFTTLKECLTRRILSNPHFQMETDDASDDSLDDFTSYLASELWPILPASLQDASYDGRSDTLSAWSALDLEQMNIPPSFTDTLTSYGILAPDAPESLLLFVQKTLDEYVQEACAPPPAWKSTRASECEICERDIPLTYHHLIPRSTHDKVLRRKWHSESMINSVAWLCRYCHSMVHHVETNEELARNFYTVELLLQREDIQKWKVYAARQRYGKKRGTTRKPKVS